MKQLARRGHPNGYLHIVVHGNNRQNIFIDEKDMYKYFKTLQFIHNRDLFVPLAYCAMTNHVHLLMRSRFVAIGKVMGLLNKRNSDYYRKSHGFVGQIYRNCYYSKKVEGRNRLLYTSAYIHRHPIDTKIQR